MTVNSVRPNPVTSANPRATLNVQGDPIATDEDAVAVLRRCRRLFCVYLGVLHYLRTQWDRREDATPV
uniref:Uncharacterized protein n=1 Tax=Magallana gigas TaxID=29159 RepID=K1QSD6_MAGGI